MNFKILLIISHFNLLNGADIIVYPTVGANWTSATFLIPGEARSMCFWPVCGKQSSFYCLFAYETDEYNGEPAVALDVINYGVRNLELIERSQKFSVLTHNAFRAAEKVFLPMYKRHNFFVAPDGRCCAGQYSSYYRYGLQALKILPELYVTKITDYSEVNKTLNLIWSYYLEDCDINIVTKVGFGKGRLVRNHHHTSIVTSRRFCWVFSLAGPITPPPSRNGGTFK